MAPRCVLILFLVLVFVTAFSYAIPMGMVLNFHTRVMINRTWCIWPTLVHLNDTYHGDVDPDYDHDDHRRRPQPRRAM